MCAYIQCSLIEENTYGVQGFPHQENTIRKDGQHLAFRAYVVVV